MKLLRLLIIPSILASLCLLAALATAPAQHPEARTRGKHSHADDAAKAEQTTPTPKPNAIVKIKSTKSNASERVAVPTPKPSSATTINNSKSNTYPAAVGAQNRSNLGGPNPPVYLPKVVPPRTPRAAAADRKRTGNGQNASYDKATQTPTPTPKANAIKLNSSKSN